MEKKSTESADLSALSIDRGLQEDGPEHRLRGNVIRVVAVVAIIAFFMIYIFTGASGSSTEVQMAQVTKVYPAQASAVLTATGYVVAERQAAIASKATGRLEYLGVEEGDEVKLGELIAQLQHDDVDAALARARANGKMAQAALQQANANSNEARLSFNRQKDLLEKGLVAQSEFDIAEARFASSEATVASALARIEVAQAEIVSAEVDVENTNIRAPFDGTVLTKNADIGEMVAPFAASSNSRGAVVTLADMASIEVEADVSESNIQRVRPGQACEIVLDAFPSQRYPAFVHKIVPTADRAKATVLTKIRFKQRDAKVLPEMSAKVNFLSDSESDEVGMEPFLAVPEAAVTLRDGRTVVFAVRVGKVVQEPLETGRSLAGKVEIVAGEVSSGEQVVVNPSADMETGDSVEENKR